MHLLRYIAVLGVIFLWSNVTRAQTGDLVTLLHNDEERVFIQQPPVQAGAPLLVVLHDAGFSARAMQAITGLDALANEAGYAVIYPQSAEYTWDDGRAAVGMSNLRSGLDDDGFIEAAVDYMVDEHGTDASQVYVIGMGGGGTMAYRLLCRSSLPIAGIATVGASLWSYQAGACGPSAESTADVLLVNGGLDESYPPSGRRFGQFSILPADETFERFATMMGCDGDSMAQRDFIVQAQDCAADRRVVAVRAEGAGHYWLHQNHTINPTTYDVSETIVAFFEGEDWQTIIDEVPVGDTPRTYITYVPNNTDASAALPVVFALHGRPTSALDMVYFTDLNRVAEQESFIAVYPNGTGREWAYLEGLRDPATDGWTGDLTFIDALTEQVAAEYDIDPARNYVLGFSNGGYMVQRIMCDPTTRNLFAAYGIVAATQATDLIPLCRIGPVVAPIVQIHGSSDSVIPWAALEIPAPGGQRVVSLSAVDTMRFRAGLNQCSQEEIEVLEIEPQDPTSEVNIYQFVDCTADFVFYVVHRGGHNWPGVPGRIPADIAGSVNMDINAGEVIWEFFETHPQSSDE